MGGAGSIVRLAPAVPAPPILGQGQRPLLPKAPWALCPWAPLPDGADEPICPPTRRPRRPGKDQVVFIPVAPTQVLPNAY